LTPANSPRPCAPARLRQATGRRTAPRTADAKPGPPYVTRQINHVLETLTDGPYWHQRIKGILAAAGFAARRLEREEVHPIWQAWLTRATFDLSPDTKTAIKQLHQVLKDGGINIARDEFNIIDRRGDKLRCVFLLDLGVPGVLN